MAALREVRQAQPPGGLAVVKAGIRAIGQAVLFGPVVAQAAVPVHADDDEAALQSRIQDVERPLYVEAVGRLAREGWTVEGRTVRFG